MLLVQVKVIQGAFDEARTRALVERLTEAVPDLGGENLRTVTTVVVGEVRSGHRALSGSPMTTRGGCRRISARPLAAISDSERVGRQSTCAVQHICHP